MVAASRRVVIGADTHLDSNHLAVLTDAGKPLADDEFPTSPAGYAAAMRWAQSFGVIAIAGVEGTSSYGAGLTRVLQAAGIEVAEVSRPDRAARRRQGKSRWSRRTERSTCSRRPFLGPRDRSRNGLLQASKKWSAAGASGKSDSPSASMSDSRSYTESYVLGERRFCRYQLPSCPSPGPTTGKYYSARVPSRTRPTCSHPPRSDLTTAALPMAAAASSTRGDCARGSR